MKSDKTSRNSVWMYAIILFTSAFVVLLLTAYSQIKMNNNIDEYKNQISSQENAKNNIQTNLGAALNDVKKLTEELNTLKKENEDLKKQIDSGNNVLNKQQQKAATSLNAYDLLINAQNEYETGNYVASADILYNKIDSKLLGRSGVVMYEDLINKVYVKASELLYFEGYKYYTSSKYDEAIKSLEKSFNYSTEQYFSDDCLYFTGYAYYKTGNKSEAKAYMQKLLEMYPDSSYKKDAEIIIKSN